jgi:outer membrane receptor protein involved in Fe transport
MIDRDFRKFGFALLASTALTAAPAWAQDPPPPTQDTTGQSPAPGTNAVDVTAPAAQQASEGVDQTEIVITATKREENLQDVPIAVTVLGTRKLDQLNISNFEEYTKQLPSVSFQTAQPGFTTVYMRGVATGGDGNHSGSLPSVGTYLDEQPVTTIGGTLDVHIYDIARIESLAGPQGTLYGASSQAGTIRIITNKPEIGVTSGRVDGEINSVAHGGIGGKFDGMINLPISNNMAFRAVAFYERDSGYIDNVFGERTYLAPDPADDVHVDNSCCIENDFNDLDTYGGRAALKIDLNEDWTILPTFLYQKSVADGVFFMDREQDDLDTVRFRPEIARDKFWQAALTIQGSLSNFDITYAGAYMDRRRFADTDYTDYTDTYNQYYIDYYNYYLDYYGFPPSFCAGPGILGCNAYRDDNGDIIDPRQHITGTDHFRKMSHELRIASPVDKPIRALVGAFYQRQTNHIFQNYLVDNLATDFSVTGYPGTLWLTNQRRVDKDWALFGEANFDITPQVTLTAGGRLYKFDNTLFGFAGFGFPNPLGGGSGSNTGENRCLTVNGEPRFEDPNSPLATGDLDYNIPCFNVANVDSNGRAIPRRSKGDGVLYRFNGTWKPQENLMFYATWSKGFRPGGINRQPLAPPYQPDFLINYELGWKTTLFGSRLRWNGAVYHQKWEDIQFSFLGLNSLTVIQNGRDARINGIETDINYTVGGLSLTAAAAYTDAKTKGNICEAAIEVDPSPDCSGIIDINDPDDPDDDDFNSIVTPSGTRLPITPKFKASVTARYAWPVWAGRAHVQGALAYQSSARSDLDPGQNALLGRLKSSTLVDLFAGYSWKNYNVELFGSNIFDERNELSRFVVCSICTQVKIVPGRPRTIGLRAGMKF